MDNASAFASGSFDCDITVTQWGVDGRRTRVCRAWRLRREELPVLAHVHRLHRQSVSQLVETGTLCAVLSEVPQTQFVP